MWRNSDFKIYFKHLKINFIAILTLKINFKCLKTRRFAAY